MTGDAKRVRSVPVRLRLGSVLCRTYSSSIVTAVAFGHEHFAD